MLRSHIHSQIHAHTRSCQRVASTVNTIRYLVVPVVPNVEPPRGTSFNHESTQLLTYHAIPFQPHSVSTIMTVEENIGEAIEDDWSTVDTNGFAIHDCVEIEWSSSETPLMIACVSTLSPLDMMNLSEGFHDATGHRIWMGAMFFIHALRSEAMQTELRETFQGKSILELGCGTGLSGITLLKDMNLSCREVVMTDCCEDVIHLCQTNCTQNLDPTDTRWRVLTLTWGLQSQQWNQEFDTVLATDILYDIESFPPLLISVCQYLSPNGMFVLSHVPRAVLPGNGKVSTEKELEQYIVEQTTLLGFTLQHIIRPCNLQIPNTVGSDFQEMNEAGVAILIFQRLSSSTCL